MPDLVGVHNAPPVYTRGLRDVLEHADFTLEVVADPPTWLRRSNCQVLMVGVHHESDLEVVTTSKAASPETAIVTLVDVLGDELVQASLLSGAAGSIPLEAGAEEVLLALRAARAGHAVLPAGVARVLAEGADARPRRPPIPAEQVAWLKALASGETVASLGSRLGYSEREMYRRLRRIYSRLGAAGRTEALIRLARGGWLD